MITNMVSWEKFAGKGINTISQSGQEFFCSRNIHSAFLPYFLQKDHFLKSAPLCRFVCPYLF